MTFAKLGPNCSQILLLFFICLLPPSPTAETFVIPVFIYIHMTVYIHHVFYHTMTFRYIHFINVLFARYLILYCSKYSLNTNIHYKIWTTGNESEMLRANFNCGVWIRCNTFSAKCSVSDFQIYMFHKYFIVNSGEWIIYILKMQHIVQSAQSVCKSWVELAAKIKYCWK